MDPDHVEGYWLFVVVTLILLSTFLFIIYRYSIGDLRFIAGRGDGEVFAHTLRVEQPMCKVFNPFNITLLHPQKSTLNGDIRFKISSLVDCWVGIYGGVLISEVFPLIHAHWSVVKDLQSLGSLLKEISEFEQDCSVPEGCEEEITVQPHSIDLGSTPRSRYPLTVFIVNRKLLHTDESELVNCSEIGMMACILHVRDEVCTAESHVIAQFIRTPYGPVHDLKKLYVAESSFPSPSGTQQSTSSSNPLNNINVQRETLCVVCQSDEVHRALLPCRHACVCNQCFDSIQQCPMCMAMIVNSIDLQELGFH